jgi:hypothetical protein
MGERLHDRTETGGPKLSEALLAQFEAMNARPEQLAKLRSKAEPTQGPVTVDIEADVWDAFRVFRLVFISQWRRETFVAGKKIISTRHGLDYTAIAAVAGGVGVPASEAFWEQIAAMETIALGIHRTREAAALRRL